MLFGTFTVLYLVLLVIHWLRTSVLVTNENFGLLREKVGVFPKGVLIYSIKGGVHKKYLFLYGSGSSLYCTVLYCTVLYCTVLDWTGLDWTGLDCTVLRTRSEAREMYTPVQIVKIQSVQTGSDGTCVAPVLFIHITHDSKIPNFSNFSVHPQWRPFPLQERHKTTIKATRISTQL